MSEATKREWSFGENQFHQFEIVDKPGHLAAICHDGSIAADIVACVNMHDGLVAAIKAAKLYCSHRDDCDYWAGGECDCDWNATKVRLESALAGNAKPEPVEPVELVVGGEYEVLRYTFKGREEPDLWVPAKCIELGKGNLYAPLFEVYGAIHLGNALQVRRVEGEYRKKATEHAEATT